MDKEQQMTIEKLADLIRLYHEQTQERFGDLESEIKRLEDGQFTAEEKENLLSVVEHINMRLENDALGKKDITLTRSEYDKVSLAQPFVNRFEVLSEAGAE